MTNSTDPIGSARQRSRFFTKYGETQRSTNTKLWAAVALLVVLAIIFIWKPNTFSLTRHTVETGVANLVTLVAIGFYVRIRWVLLTACVLAGLYYGLFQTLA